MKLKAVLIALAIFLVTGLFIKIKFLQVENEMLEIDRDRNKANYMNATAEAQQNKVYYLKEKELSESLRLERDNLAEKLRVKPKQIEKIVKVETVIRDTIVKEIPVKPIITGWEFADSSDCYVYKGRVSYTHDSLRVYKTGFFYTNELTSTYYRKRPHKFIIRYGKYENFVQTESKCGEAKTEQFNFIK